MAARFTNNAYDVYGAPRRWEEDEFTPSRQSRPRRKEQMLPETLKKPEYTRTQKREIVRRGKNAMYLAIAVGVICVFIQVARYAQIAVNSKQISALRTEIQQLDKQKENYELRISARENKERLENEIIGMGCFSKATMEQTRVIVLNRDKPEKLTVIAANTAN